MSWAREQGSPSPLGATWIAAEEAYNFALYSKDAEEVTVLLYAPKDLANPVFSYSFDRFKNKTGPVWHARIRKDDMGNAGFYAYSVGGSQKAFRPEKVLLDPYAKEVFFLPRMSGSQRLPEVATREGLRWESFAITRWPLTGEMTVIRATTGT